MKFGYTLMYVQDVQKSVEFYEAAFGLTRNFIHEGGYGELNTGETKLGFVSLELARSNGTDFLTTRTPAIEIGLVTEDVAGAFAKAVAAGAEPVAEPKQKPWGQTVAYVKDRNGFLVELCSPMG